MMGLFQFKFVRVGVCCRQEAKAVARGLAGNACCAARSCTQANICVNFVANRRQQVGVDKPCQQQGCMDKTHDITPSTGFGTPSFDSFDCQYHHKPDELAS